MSVVQRCPNCGTTQAAAGECDACHEAQVQYFCTNHAAWMDAPRCPRCEAFSTAIERPPPPIPARARPVARAKERPRAPPARPVDDRVLEVATRRPSLWETVVRGALVARSPHEPAPISRAGGWFVRLLLRLALIAVVITALLAVSIYMVATSF